MDVMSEKKALRLQVKLAKGLLTDEQRALQSEEVWSRLEELDVYKMASNVLCYWSLPDELASHEFILRAYKHKNIYLPKVVGDNLTLHQFEGLDSMKKGCYGIMEPQGNELNDLKIIDLAVIPGIAFSPQGKRMGRGKAFYDGLLPQLKNTYKVGVGYHFQLLEHIPYEAHDIDMDRVITSLK